MKKQIVILGGGAAGLMASVLLSEYFSVIIIEKEKSLGRKFLVAGKGGFNLTNSANGQELIKEYSMPESFKKVLRDFDSEDLRNFLFSLGVETFVGTSGRVFPKKGIKPIEVLNAFVEVLEKNKVAILLKNKVIKINDNSVVLQGASASEVYFDYCVLAFGGASWPKTGSDGKWVSLFNREAVAISEFMPSNCGINITWPLSILEFHQGKPLKNISLTIGKFNIKGEALITRSGLEGNAVYPLIAIVREELRKNKKSSIFIDFKPNNTSDSLLQKLKGKTRKEYSKVLSLDAVTLALLKAYTKKEDYFSVTEFVKNLKSLEVVLTGLRPLDEAISSVGGLEFKNLNQDYSLKENTAIYAIGEMLNWDAPTGGFLLQGCFSMANGVAKAIIEKESFLSN